MTLKGLKFLKLTATLSINEDITFINVFGVNIYDYFPIISNTIFCGIFGFIADHTAQRLAIEKEFFEFDESRSAKFALTTMLLTPFNFGWYQFLEKQYGHSKDERTILRKLFLDVTVYTPLEIFGFYCLQSYLEGDSLSKWQYRFSTTGIYTCLTEMIADLPIEYISFKYIPRTYAVVFEIIVSHFLDIFNSYMFHA